MKKSLVLSAATAVLSMALFSSTFAQSTATQSVTLAVNTVYKIATSGNPGPLTITDATAGVDALTSVSDNSTTYSITQNFGNTVKITAHMDAVLAAGYTLELNLASIKGTSAGVTDISNATSGSAVDVVTTIQRGADAGQGIGYTFSATATAGTLSSTTRTITLTLTN
ncbi:MAG: hypothetical protein WEB37_03400 [Bacteroidota bacterium]